MQFANRLWIVGVVLLALMLGVASFAEEAVFLQANGVQGTMDLFVRGPLDVANLRLSVSNQSVDLKEIREITDPALVVRTTMLLDISTSMPVPTRASVLEAMELMIQNKAANEEMRIVTFAEELRTLRDFTTDRYDLAKALESIAFDGQESKLYDAIYHTLPETEAVNGKSCFYRTVVITDGIDDTASGITREELYLHLKADPYPIDVMAVSAVEQAEPEKQLSALTRISQGRYWNLHAATDLRTGVPLSSDAVLCVSAALPLSFFDGSIRQFDLTDGAKSLRFDVKVPVYGSSGSGSLTEPASKAQETETRPKSESKSERKDGKKPSQSVDPTESKRPDADGSSNGDEGILGLLKQPLYLGIGAAVLLLPIVLLLIFRKKKPKPQMSSSTGVSSANDSPEPASSNPFAAAPRVGSHTEMIDVGMGTASDPAVGGPSRLRVRNVDNPDQIWNVSLASPIVVGREQGSNIHLAESSISRKQCRFYEETGRVMIENLSESNVTRLNEEKLTAPKPLRESDRIRCGRVTLMIDAIYRAQEAPKSADDSGRKTEFMHD
ncbi:MAG: FHA domain-containing protein [Bacillota bacterium]|nr:FHA domain-containing protein [Bacillota bacterium]